MWEQIVGSRDWTGVAIAAALAFLTAYACAVLAGRLVKRTLSSFGGDHAEQLRQWQGPARVTRVIVFIVVLVALALPALDLAGAGMPVHASRAALLDWLVASGLRILVILLLSYLLVRAIAASSTRLEAQIMSGGGPDRVEHVKRARTLGRLVRNALTALVLGVATLMILRELNVDVLPVLTGAGVVGLAVGFGAQTLVKDVISGFFLILDDYVRVGDVARINNTGGLVEAINLRTIVLRDHEGTVHVFPNGSITTLSNLTKDFAYAVVDVGFNYNEDTERVVETLREVGNAVAANPTFAPNVIGPVEIQAVEGFANGQMTVRMRLKARPQTQWDIARELRWQIKLAFDERRIAFPQAPITVALAPPPPASSTATAPPAPGSQDADSSSTIR